MRRWRCPKCYLHYTSHEPVCPACNAEAGGAPAEFTAPSGEGQWTLIDTEQVRKLEERVASLEFSRDVQASIINRISDQTDMLERRLKDLPEPGTLRDMMRVVNNHTTDIQMLYRRLAGDGSEMPEDYLALASCSGSDAWIRTVNDLLAWLLAQERARRAGGAS